MKVSGIGLQLWDDNAAIKLSNGAVQYSKYFKPDQNVQKTPINDISPNIDVNNLGFDYIEN